MRRIHRPGRNPAEARGHAGLGSVAIAAGITLLAASALPAQSLHTNEEVGYRLKIPKHYETQESGGFFFSGLPDDLHCVDRFERKIPIPTSNLFDYDLYLATYFFPKAREQRPDSGTDERSEEKKDAEQKAKELRIGGRHYEHFADWARDRIQGFYFSDEEKKKIAGREATLYEMKFEKLTSVPERWMACSYPVPGGEFAVVFNCTDEQFDKWRRTFYQTFASLKVLADDGLKLPERDAGIRVVDNSEEAMAEGDAELTPEQRRQRLVGLREKRFQEEIDKLESGWRPRRTDHYLVLSEADSRLTKTVERHVEAMRSWLEETFPSLGDGFVQDAIVRVYARPPRDATRITLIIGGGSIDEFEYWKPTSRFGLSEFHSLNDDLVRHWFSQKNSELWNRMPTWFRWGLMEYVQDATSKGSKIRFEADSYERLELARALALQEQFEKKREGDAVLLPVQEIFRLTADEQRDAAGWRFLGEQNASVLRFLIEGPGRKWDRTEGVLTTYLASMYRQIQEVEQRLEKERKAKEAAVEKPDSAKTEEELLAEEDAAYEKRRQETYDKVEKEILEHAYADTFGAWSESDWKQFERRWRSYAKQGAR